MQEVPRTRQELPIERKSQLSTSVAWRQGQKALTVCLIRRVENTAWVTKASNRDRLSERCGELGRKSDSAGKTRWLSGCGDEL